MSALYPFSHIIMRNIQGKAMNLQLKNASIKAIFSTIPQRIISLESEVDKLYNGDYKKYERIKKSIGLDKRYIADSKTTTLDLCLHSARALLDSAIIAKDSLDAIIFVTQTPDFLQPSNAHILHGRLELKMTCACFDLNAGCSGYVYGLFMAYSLLQNGAKQVLLCVGDTISKIVDPLDSNTAPLFGDAGSATLISYDENAKNSFFTLHSLGSGFEYLIFPNSGFRLDSREKFLYMNGAEVFNFSIDKEPKAIKEILEFANRDINSIDYIFFHQANAYIISNIARRLNLPIHKAPSQSVSKYGNTSSASIPLAICDKLGARDQNLNSTLQVILSGFGVGLSWASALLELEQETIISQPLIYKEQ